MDGKNVVWTVVDSVRADHTSLHGYDRETTPRLAEIASRPDGVGFQQCITHGIWSLTSVASMLTGLYPSQHRVGFEHDALGSELKTVPERFREAGYRTVALSINPFVSRATGLDRGFDEFDERLAVSDFLSPDAALPLFKFLRNVRRDSAGFTPDAQKHQQDYVINEMAKRKVSRLAKRDQPFFLFVHFHGPHHPYYSPLGKDGLLREWGFDPEQTRRTAFERSLDSYAEMARIHAGEYTEAEWQALEAAYDATLAHCDELVGDLFDHVNARTDDTAFVATADHGDLFGEHGVVSHKLLTHDGLIHVPAVVHGVDGLAASRDDLVQHNDLMRTLLEVGGAETDGMEAIDVREESKEFTITQRGEPTRRKTIGEIREFAPDYENPMAHESSVTALRTHAHKYQRSEDRSELFELPDETTDVSDAQPELAAELDEKLDAWFDAIGTVAATDASAEFDQATQRRLRDLGYVVD
jgi:uncharacterized sulfatase